MINRRQFLFGLTAVGAVTALPFLSTLGQKKQWLVSGASDNKGNYFVAAFDLSGQVISKIPLPARAHEVLAINSKPGHALVIARRPGNYVMEVNFNRGEIVEQVNVTPENRFYGHGVLLDNDNILLTTENDYAQGKGLITLRDIKTQQVLEQYDSGGIGPHQLAVMPQTKEGQIVIANGGIQTHPAQGRKKLNIKTMTPNLAYLDLANGKVVDSFELENKHLSIRHLDVSNEGKVIAGMQYQGASTDQVPLALAHHGESRLQFLKADAKVWQNMNHYTASVCINNQQKSVAITCPRAKLITYWQLDTHEFISSYKLKDVAGVTVVNNQFIASTGRGRVTSQESPFEDYQVLGDLQNLRCDNHMTAIATV